MLTGKFSKVVFLQSMRRNTLEKMRWKCGKVEFSIKHVHIVIDLISQIEAIHVSGVDVVFDQ